MKLIDVSEWYREELFINPENITTVIFYEDTEERALVSFSDSLSYTLSVPKHTFLERLKFYYEQGF